MQGLLVNIDGSGRPQWVPMDNEQVGITEHNHNAWLLLAGLFKHYGVEFTTSVPFSVSDPYTDKILQTVALAAYPLRKLEHNSGYLVAIEALSGILPSLIRTMAVAERRQNTPPRKLNSLHLYDDHGHMNAAMGKFISRLTYETSRQISWNWLATHSDKINPREVLSDRDHYLYGVDGTCTLSQANQRALKNKILTSCKHIDIVTCEGAHSFNAIIFAVINLAKHGCAVIHLPFIDDSIASAVAAASECFVNTNLLHAVAEDRMYLCCGDFCGIPAAIRPTLYNLCDEKKTLESSPDTIVKVAGFNATVAQWKYLRCCKLLALRQKVIDESLVDFGHDVGITCDDISDEWAQIHRI